MVKEQMKQLNINPLAIARFFYEKEIYSHLFIQKLIYFSFLESLKNNLLLFPEKFQAWKYGPVLRSVFEGMTNNNLDLDIVFAQFPRVQKKEVISLLEKTYQNYGHYDVWDLVRESHYGPWERARGDLEVDEISTQEIELDEMIKFVNDQE